jgi:hypothetical protein
MLRRAQLRKYLLALLWHDDVYQTADCEKGPLWVNCNGERIEVFDHETHQIFDNEDARYNLDAKDAVIIFHFESVRYNFTSTASDKTAFRLNIDIVVNDSSGRKRQDILDIIEERIFYRIISYQSFTNAQTGEAMPSFMNWLNRNELMIETRDDSGFLGDYTKRMMLITFEAQDCIRRPGCDDIPLCFDMDLLTKLDGDCNPSTPG